MDDLNDVGNLVESHIDVTEQRVIETDMFDTMKFAAFRPAPNSAVFGLQLEGNSIDQSHLV
jgi:hypothetical protein